MKAQYIGDLLFDHECVIVPGLGGFITSYVPARIDKDTHRFYPPSCRVAFNAGLSANDGILANHISASEKIPYKMAMEQIRKWTDDCFRKFQSGESLHLEDLGFLSMNAEGKLVFEPEVKVNFLGNAYGLPSFIAQAVHREEDLLDKTPYQPATLPSRFRHLLPETLKWAAVVTPFLAFALWGSLNGEKIDNYIQNYSGLNAWVQTTPGKSATVKVMKPSTGALNQEESSYPAEHPASHKALSGAIPSVISYNALRQAQSPSMRGGELITAADTKLSYFIIGGAFREKRNAEKLILELCGQGYPASIIDTTSSGMFIVGISGFVNRSEAIKALPGIRQSGYDNAWIMRRG